MRLPQAEKLKAFAVLALTIGIITLGVAFSMISPRSTGGSATATPTFAPARTPGPATPAATPLPYAIEGTWLLDFAASGLEQPTLPNGLGIGSSLRLDRGRVEYGTGYGAGCDTRTGTFETDGTALAIRLGANTAGGCHEAVIDELAARLNLVVAVSMAPCSGGGVAPSTEATPDAGSCRQLWLDGGTPDATLVYVSAP